ncbi:amylo-alpha-1,6-glucosidase [Phytoactinopolyspora limicola]|uniref:amylo-alpha-1,6-glucosidase n=1 Tax=Phytoactinopolyspora limicola TaxID=2715536 RepID=UPI00140E29E8|nr:glycogen debranching protein [Phytoactinopolyspora limicola]
MADTPMPTLDLVESPFTDAGSRLLVTQSGGMLTITSAEYERRSAECRLLPGLRVRTVTGRSCPVHRADPAAIYLTDGPSLVFADATTLSLGLPPGRWRVEFHVAGAVDLTADGGLARTDLTGTGGEWLTWHVDGGVVEQVVGGSIEAPVVTLDVDGPADGLGSRVVLQVQGEPVPAAVPAGHAELLARAVDRWAEWFGRMPVVRSDLVMTARLAWWVLRANQVRVAHDPSRLMVVPSKFGYVGAWQWDSYFVAAGLRHGAPEQAWDQVALFLDHQLSDGLIPDVVSDDGILASADDLPPADAARLRDHLGDAAGVASGSVPVTKPPLTAWALAHLHRLAPDPDRLAWALPRVEASQRWWATVSDTDGDGLSEYLHPYSSGLDDSPLFDYGVPAEPPDLNSYLALQDDLLADLTEGTAAAVPNVRAEADRHRGAAAERVTRLLDRRWDAGSGRFTAHGGGRRLPMFTPFHLMPLLTGRLPEAVVDVLVASMYRDLWGEHPLPTVAYGDATFDADRMWRGPVWVNVNRLVAEGLLRSGRPDAAADLAERTLALVAGSGGMYEYWNPLTGGRASRATTSFAWSAALYIDLAVAVTNDLDLLRSTSPNPP